MFANIAACVRKVFLLGVEAGRCILAGSVYLFCPVAVFWLTHQKEEVRLGTAGPRVLELCDVFGINFVVVS